VWNETKRAPRPRLNRPTLKMEKLKGAVKMRDLGIRIKETRYDGSRPKW
jgi:hypothetical protein